MIRDAHPDDVPAMLGIFAAEVAGSTASYETTPPDLGEYRSRFDRVMSGPNAWLVAEVHGEVAGFAYFGSFRERWGYRFTVENSVYVASGFRGRGIARALMDRLIARAQAAGFRQMVAVIGDAENRATLRLHAACGFREVGVIREAGHKFGQWLDLVIMQRPLSG